MLRIHPKASPPRGVMQITEAPQIRFANLRNTGYAPPLQGGYGVKPISYANLHRCFAPKLRGPPPIGGGWNWGWMYLVRSEEE